MASEHHAGTSISLEPGTRLGDLELVRRVGAGAQGEVWEARQTGVERRVAVKIQRAPPGGAGAERFRREAAAAARLSHAGIVGLHDLRELGDLRLIVQEFVDGESLAAMIERRRAEGRPPDAAWCRRAVEICVCIADALQHAHERGVVHRDVKPGNVLISAEGTPKLADFGLARVQGSPALSRTGEILGTPWFMSPEQVLGQPSDARTDVYGLGAVLYDLLTLQVPHPGDDERAVFAHILGRMPRPPRALAEVVAPDLQAVCLKALERWPQDRYATASELADDLRRVQRGEPTLARPVGWCRRTWRGVARASAPALAAWACSTLAGWLALERWVLAPAVVESAGVTGWRQASLWVAAAFLLCPVALLAGRAARGLGRRAALPAALAAASLVLLGGSFVLRVLNHRLDRAVIAAALSDSPARALALKGPFVDRWGDRLDPQDDALLALVLLSNERPDAADVFVAALTGGTRVSAVGWALETAVAVALVQEDRELNARKHLVLNEEADLDADEWTTIGDVFAAIHQWSEARAAYLRAAGLRKSARLDLRIAQLDVQQCNWPAAQARIDLSLQESPNDLAWQLIALDVALRGPKPIDKTIKDHLKTIEGHLNIIKLNATRPWIRLNAEYRVLTWRKSKDVEPLDVEPLLTEAESRAGSDPEVVDWLASVAQERSNFDKARHLYSHLVDISLAPEARAYKVTAHIGLSASAVKLGEFDTAKQEAFAAISADPTYSESYRNLFVAQFMQARKAAHGVEDDIEPASWSEFASTLERGLSQNGLAVQTLNNLAYVLMQAGKPTADAALVSRAMACADRAIKAAETDAGCLKSEPGLREQLSNALDTRSQLHQQRRECEAAIDDQRRAVEVLEPQDKNYDRRSQRLAKLKLDGC